jgi:TolB-like protein/DNA-binding winged helix-turn-helix (wHTH) protein/tetratricopeptide (TPR) repeat protein
LGSLTRYRFGVFEFDTETPELRKSGRPVRLRPQGFKLLRLLISRPREVIAREEIARFLWDAGVFVDFEQGVNHIIKQLRAALGDDAESPRYIETLPRRGYRFIAPVEALVASKEAPVRADGTELPGPLELRVRGDPATPAVEIADARLKLAANASTSLSPSAPLHVIGPTERHRIALAVVTCALLSMLGVGWWATFRPPVASGARASVAVLPFTTIGGGGDYFADGLTEALTTELGTMQGLRVIASNTAFSYRDRPTLRDIARELGVGLVVTGSVQRHDASVRINASLVDTSDGTTLWSAPFSRQVTDVLTVQNEISENIARTLSKTVGVALAKAPSATRNPEAYDAYMRGLWHFKGRSSTKPSVRARASNWRSAVAEFERAVALDPEFALARAALASAYTQLFFYDSTDSGFDEKAFLEIRRALAIDPNLPEAYLARAQLTWTARNHFPHEAAITDLRRAVTLNANLADAYLELEKVYYHIGLTDKVIAAGQQVQRLDPSQALSSNRTFRALIDADRLEQVRVEVDRNGNLGPYARGDALVALGRHQDALQLLSGSKATQPGDADYDIGALTLLAVVYARLNQPKEAERILAMAIPAAENPTALSHIHHAQFHIGATFGLLGRKADAVRWLTKAADDGYPSYPRFSTDQSLAPLKGYPAYEALLIRLRNDWNRWEKSLQRATP